MVLTVVNRLHYPTPNNGLQEILKTYNPPNATHGSSPQWLLNFSTDVKPISCHSHNDYKHHVPLYQGLAAGCVSTEVDIWATDLNGKNELLVGHGKKELKDERTIESLYLDPLISILDQQNAVSRNGSSNSTFSENSPVGVFSMEPKTSLILVVDFKTNTPETWTTLLEKLEPAKAKDYLTHWTLNTGIVQRPLTIVASGEANFDTLISNNTYRNIFYDAPLTKLSEHNTPYNSNNSYYASTSLGNAVGMATFGRLTAGQKDTVEKQTKKAEELGLKSRYWDTLVWPVSWRNRMWEVLLELGANMLNVDDLTAAARWDWHLCVIAGVAMCDS